MYAPGEVAEWSNAPDLKSGELKGSVGSNPTLSVFEKMPDFWAIATWLDTPDSIDSRKGPESIAQTPLHSNNSNYC